MLGHLIRDINEIFSEFENFQRRSKTFIKYDEENNKWIAEVELPGFSKDQVDISLVENTVTVKAEKNNGEEQKFFTSFRIGDNIDTNSISASLEDGILTLEFSVIEPPVKKIELK